MIIENSYPARTCGIIINYEATFALKWLDVMPTNLAKMRLSISFLEIYMTEVWFDGVHGNHSFIDTPDLFVSFGWSYTFKLISIQAKHPTRQGSGKALCRSLQGWCKTVN